MDAMPGTRRGTSRLLDTIDEHGAAVARLRSEAEADLADGVLDEREARRLVVRLREMERTFQAVVHDGLVVDQSFSMLRTLAHTADIAAPQVQRSFREFTQDRQRLDAARQPLTYGEVVDTFTRLDGKHPLARPEVTHALAD